MFQICVSYPGQGYLFFHLFTFLFYYTTFSWFISTLFLFLSGCILFLHCRIHALFQVYLLPAFPYLQHRHNRISRKILKSASSAAFWNAGFFISLLYAIVPAHYICFLLFSFSAFLLPSSVVLHSRFASSVYLVKYNGGNSASNSSRSVNGMGLFSCRGCNTYKQLYPFLCIFVSGFVRSAFIYSFRLHFSNAALFT